MTDRGQGCADTRLVAPAERASLWQRGTLLRFAKPDLMRSVSKSRHLGRTPTERCLLAKSLALRLQQLRASIVGLVSRLGLIFAANLSRARQRLACLRGDSVVTLRFGKRYFVSLGRRGVAHVATFRGDVPLFRDNVLLLRVDVPLLLVTSLFIRFSTRAR